MQAVDEVFQIFGAVERAEGVDLPGPAEAGIHDAEPDAGGRIGGDDRPVVAPGHDQHRRRDVATRRRDDDRVGNAGQRVEPEHLRLGQDRLVDALMDDGETAGRVRVDGEPLLEHVGDIHRVEGRAPSGVAGVAEDHERNAREAGADDVEAGVAGPQMVLVEGRRRAESEMRVVGEQRPAGDGVGSVDRPFVAAARIVGAPHGGVDMGQGSNPIEIIPPQRDGFRADRRPVPDRGGRHSQGRGDRGGTPAQGRGDRGGEARRNRVGVRDGRGRVERGAALDVLEEQRRAVEAGKIAHRLISHQRLGTGDVVEVEGQAEGEQLCDRQAVDRRPRLERGQFQDGVFGRQRVRRDIGVDAGGIGVERRQRLVRQHVQRPFRGAPQAERAQFHVTRQDRPAQQLGQRAAGPPALQIHLEQPVAGVRPALHQQQVVLGLGDDVRDAVGIARHLGLLVETGDLHCRSRLK